MVWQENCFSIVMITKLVEVGRVSDVHAPTPLLPLLSPPCAQKQPTFTIREYVGVYMKGFYVCDKYRSHRRLLCMQTAT